MWPGRRPSEPERLSRFWDERIAGRAEPTQAEHDLDPTLIEAVERLRARDDARLPDPAFLDRLEETLMEAIQTMQPGLAPLHPPSPAPTNGAVPAPVRPRHAPGRRTSGRWAPARLVAAALLVLALAAGLLALGPLRPGRGDDPPARLAAPGTPAPARPAEPLWQSTGGPGLPLDDPYQVALDPRGNLWVADGLHSRFQVFAPDGEFLEAWGAEGSSEGQFRFHDPDLGTGNLFDGTGMGAAAFDATGNLYVVDPGNRRVQKFGPDRRFLLAWGGEGQGDGQFVAPTDVAVDAAGQVYVADSGRDDVQVFDADVRFLARWGGRGTEPGKFQGPEGIALDPAGNVVVADYGGNRVQTFSPAGELLGAWGSPGRAEGQLSGPADVAVDAAGRVYVAEPQAYRVQVFDGGGRFLAAWGSYGVGPGQFAAPIGVAVDRAGRVYVAESANDRVQAFRLRLPPPPAATPAP